MKLGNPIRASLHTTTMPPKNQEISLDDLLTKKDPRETKELISNVFETGSSGPDLYNILLSSPSSLKLRIPETLYKHQNNIYYLSNDEKGLVKIQTGESILKEFIKLTENPKSQIPNYLFFDNTYKICTNSKQVREFWHVSKSEKKVVQKYICSQKQKVYKLRVYWKLNYGMRFLILTGQIPTLVKNSKSKEIKPEGIYKYKISEFNYAGRLLKTSFDPTLPNRSSIRSSSEKKITQGSCQEANNTKHYLVRFSDLKSPVHEVTNIPGIKEIVENILNYLNKHILQPDLDLSSQFDKEVKENILSELVVDFLLDDAEYCWFLKCKAYKTNIKAPKYLEFYHSISLNENRLNPNNKKKNDMLEIASINSRLKSLGSKSKEFLNKHKIALKLNSTRSSNKDFYSAHFDEINIYSNKAINPLYSKHIDLYSNEINKVANHYDEIRSQAKKNKVETQRRQSLIENDQKIKLIVLNALMKINSYPELQKVSEHSESFFSGFLNKVLDEEKALSFFIKFQAIYDWTITLKQFRVVSNIFAEECKRFGLFSNRDFLVFTKIRRDNL